MPHRNRVFPDGSIHAIPQKGAWLGNRGGRFHRDNQTLKSREFASKQWIYCVLKFKNRHREVLQKGYTELFFCDEAGAIASGHRPCFECQRERAKLFASYWQKAFSLDAPPKVKIMDEQFHQERLAPKIAYTGQILPEGAMIQTNEGFFTFIKNKFMLYSWQEKSHCLGNDVILTPPSMLKLLEAGFPLLEEKVL